jgi:hypothetical protein
MPRIILYPFIRWQYGEMMREQKACFLDGIIQFVHSHPFHYFSTPSLFSHIFF